MSTGAVVAGRGTVEPAGYCGGDHHEDVPIFILTRQDPAHLKLIPVLFGQGRRLFDGLAAKQIELERTPILEGENGVTHMHYRVQHSDQHHRPAS
jgi:hypothetical protein